MCISRFVRLLLGSEQPSATGSLAVHQGLYGASFRVWLLVYLRVHLIAACGGQPKAAFQDTLVCSFWVAAYGEWPKAPFQCVQGLYFSFCCVWWAAEGRLSAYSGLQLAS